MNKYKFLLLGVMFGVLGLGVGSTYFVQATTGAGREWVYGVSLDTDGNVYSCGFASIRNGNPSVFGNEISIPSTKSEAWIAKQDEDGDIQRFTNTTQHGGSQGAHIECKNIVSNDDYTYVYFRYANGQGSGSFQGEPLLFYGQYTIALAKLDNTDGSLVWLRHFTAGQTGYINANVDVHVGDRQIYMDSDENVYMIFQTTSPTIYMQTGASQTGVLVMTNTGTDQDVGYLKISSAGNFMTGAIRNSSGEELAASIAVSLNGNVFLGGRTKSSPTIFGNTSITRTYNGDAAYLISRSANNVPQGIKLLETSTGSTEIGVHALDTYSGKVVAVGAYRGTGKFFDGSTVISQTATDTGSNAYMIEVDASNMNILSSGFTIAQGANATSTCWSAQYTEEGTLFIGCNIKPGGQDVVDFFGTSGSTWPTSGAGEVYGVARITWNGVPDRARWGTSSVGAAFVHSLDVSENNMLLGGYVYRVGAGAIGATTVLQGFWGEVATGSIYENYDGYLFNTDVRAPQFRNLSISNGQQLFVNAGDNSKQIDFSWETDESPSGIANMYYQISQSPTFSPIRSQSDSLGSASQELGIGTRYRRIVATNGSGITQYSDPIEFVINNTIRGGSSPVIASSSNGGGSRSSSGSPAISNRSDDTDIVQTSTQEDEEQEQPVDSDEVALDMVTTQEFTTQVQNILETNTAVNEEEAQAYVFARSNNITTQETYAEARAYDGVTRGEFAKMLVNFVKTYVDKQADQTKTACMNYSDIEDQDDLKEYIVTACQMGLMGLETDGETALDEFMPNQSMNRAQIATTISRALYGNMYNGGEPYYQAHMDALLQADIISVNNPDLQDTRINIFTMMMRMAMDMNN